MKLPVCVLHEESELYPPLLSEIPGAPNTLYYRGILPTSHESCVAIVGTRKASREGLALAHELAETLALRGITIVSGLALGIDAAAHEGTLKAGGRTIAVLANGLDHVYPRQHEHLAEHILESGGCLISEYVEGTPAYPNQFLERNRIVSGLSIATIVIEAPLRSGSIATARNAIEQGREVFVFPGSVNNANYKGSHMLIRNGARLVTNCADILEDLGVETSPSLTSARENNIALSEFESQIVRVLTSAHEPLSIDKILELTTLQPHIVNEKLTLLLFSGIIEEVSGKFRIKNN
ncbi:MAG: DNA-processing protein DprA [Candidatus Paceibacterota bacterium]|jgi:DNA processing protein